VTARALVAEALGTALLVMAVVGSGIMADRLTGDVALALLANAIATGAALIVLISCLGPVSGAHFNPVVTAVMVARRALPLRLAVPYIAAQVAGGVAGTGIAHAMFGLPLWQVSQTVRSGGGLWIAEAVATFGLILAICGAQHARGNVALIVAAYITGAYWFTASTSFANPAVTLARAFSDTFSGIRPDDVMPFWLAQLVGGAAGGLLAGWLFRGTNEKPPA
jgi:glycerol uptake facilitator-like aquaporin